MPAKAELFSLHTPDDAWAKLRAQWHPAQKSQRIATADALGCTLAERIIARDDVPSFRRATVDGYAVRASDTHGASPGLPALLRVHGEAPMGALVTISAGEGGCVLVHTGGMLPPDADAVVMVEHTQVADDVHIEVMRPVATGDNVLHIGEDIARGAVAYEAGAQLRAHDIGALMALGVTEIDVAAPPRVAIVSTGDEVVAPDQTPGPGQVRDVNSYALAALAQAHGATATRMGIVPDRRDALEIALRQAQQAADIVVVSAGSSVSARDMSVDVIDGLGRPGVLVHGITVKPGKPAIVALCDGVPVFGLPGNPASALVVAELFVVPAIRALFGANAPMPRTVRARLARNVPSSTGRLDIVPVNLEQRDDGLWAVPVFGKSNLIYTLVRADGRITIALNANGVREGEWVDVVL
jgi:molybdopterin molybdotransferase